MALKAGYKGIKKIGTGLKLTTEGTLSLDGSGPGGSVNLDDLGDVAITEPADGNILVYDSTDDEWKNAVPTSAADKADITAIGTNETGDTASKNYAAGEYFYKNGKFCTAKTAIASGATFTLNTNYVEGTVAETLGGYKVVYTTTQAIYADKMQELKTAWNGLSENDKLRAIIVLLYQGNPSHIYQQMSYGAGFVATGNVNGPSKILRFDVCDIANYTYFRVTLNNTTLSFEDLTNTSDNSQVYQLLVLN